MHNIHRTFDYITEISVDQMLVHCVLFIESNFNLFFTYENQNFFTKHSTLNFRQIAIATREIVTLLHLDTLGIYAHSNNDKNEM